MEEFANVCHHATCDNLTLMEEFRCRLDNEIQLVMQQGDSFWMLVDYLWIEESSFMVGNVQEDSVPSVQTHVTSVTTSDPEPMPMPTADKALEPTKD